MVLATDLASALDPVTFAREVLGFAPDEWQAAALRWTGRRALWNCCRQSGKSTTAAILGLHRAIFHPSSLVLLVSPSLRQSGELFRKVTELLERLDVRPALEEDNRLSCTLANRSRIVSLPSSQATIRGFSAPSLIIEDEAAQVDDAVYAACRPMLAVSNGQLILMSTPYGKRGHFHAEWTEGGAGWERVEVPAAACPRISPAFLEAERRSLGALVFRSEYLCEFTETDDAVFGYETIRAALDPAVTPIWGACV